MSSGSLPPFRTHAAPGPGAWLMLDAAWPVAAIGVWENGVWRAFTLTEGPVVESFFGAIEMTLSGAGLKLSEFSGYLYATGPGSILGLRTAAMALGTWRATPGLAMKPVLAYDSLAIACRLAKLAGLGDATVFAATRRGHWNAFSPTSSLPLECDANTLAGFPGPHLRLPSRDLGSPPVPFETFEPLAVLREHPEIFRTPGLLFETDFPDAANLANQYATWSGERHKA